MNLTEQGGTAFPADVHTHTESGMSLRDYFAAAVISEVYRQWSTQSKLEDIAYFSYVLADAMLKAREARQ